MKTRGRCQELFAMPSESARLLDDPQVSKVAQFVVGLQDFMAQYISGKEKIPREMVQVPLQPVAGLKIPEDQKAKTKYDEVMKFTCEQLGEQLYSDNRANGTSFCVSIMHFQLMASGEYFGRMETLFQMEEACETSEPIPLAEFQQVLPLNELTKSVVEMTRATSNSTWMSDLYLQNLLNKLNAGHKSHFLAEEVQAVLQNIELTVSAIDKCQIAKEHANGDKQQILENAKRMKDMMEDGSNMKTYYENELRETRKQLENAEADEKRYTYNCYGPFSWVWQNDVNLAKEKVTRYTAKIQKLEEQMKKCSDEANEMRAQEEKMQISRELAKAEATIISEKNKIEQGNEKKQNLEKLRDEKLKKLVKLMKENGCDTIDEMLNAMDAMKAVGQASASQSQRGAVVLEGWIKDLNFLAVGLNRMARAKTLKNQRSILNTLRNWTRKEDNVFCEWLRRISPLTHIPFLETREPYRRTNLPVFNNDEIAKTIEWDEPRQAQIQENGADTSFADVEVAPEAEERIYNILMESDQPMETLVEPVELPMPETAGMSAGVDLLDDYADEW